MAAKAVAAGMRGVPARAYAVPVMVRRHVRGTPCGAPRPNRPLDHRPPRPALPAVARPESGWGGRGAAREGARAALRAPGFRGAGPLAGCGPPAAPPRAGGVTLAPPEPHLLSWVAAIRVRRRASRAPAHEGRR